MRKTFAQTFDFGGGQEITVATPERKEKRELLIVYLEDLYAEAKRKLGRWFDVIFVHPQDEKEKIN